jgi:hypothetical protein
LWHRHLAGGAVRHLAERLFRLENKKREAKAPRQKSMSYSRLLFLIPGCYFLFQAAIELSLRAKRSNLAFCLHRQAATGARFSNYK